MKTSSKQADDILKPVFADFKRRARAAIEQAQHDIKNILRVRYDAEPKRIPPELPSPRLQLRWEGEDHSEWMCHYEMVFPLDQWDIRNDAKTGFGVVELGRTRVNGGPPAPWTYENVAMRLPFRDGVHAKWDAKVFGGLPIYVLGPDGSAALVPPKEQDAVISRATA